MLGCPEASQMLLLYKIEMGEREGGYEGMGKGGVDSGKGEGGRGERE